MTNFEEASHKVLFLNSAPTDDELIEVYGLYKQSTIGDCNIHKPYFWQVKEIYKWNSWNSFIGISKDDAKNQYIILYLKLKDKYGCSK